MNHRAEIVDGMLLPTAKERMRFPGDNANLSPMKHVLITGCTRGLGLAMAHSFASRGWTISGFGTKQDAVSRLQLELGEKHVIRACDVASADQVASFCREVLTTVGPPDLLLNNAAIINPNAHLWDVTPEDFSRVIDVNLKGVHHLLHYLLPSMIQRGSGVIVNFSSGWGRSTSPEVAPYCCTKWGIEGLTQALSQELPHDMAAVALNPGIIDTEMLQSTFGEGSSDYPDPATWARKAVPFLEALSHRDNGKALTAPQ